MKTRGILVEAQDGKEYLVTCSLTGSKSVRLAVCIKKGNLWQEALLPAREILTVKGLAIQAIGGLADCCGLQRRMQPHAAR